MSAIESYSMPNRLVARARRATRPSRASQSAGQHDAERGAVVVAVDATARSRRSRRTRFAGGDQVRQQIAAPRRRLAARAGGGAGGAPAGGALGASRGVAHHAAPGSRASNELPPRTRSPRCDAQLGGERQHARRCASRSGSARSASPRAIHSPTRAMADDAARDQAGDLHHAHARAARRLERHARAHVLAARRAG